MDISVIAAVASNGIIGRKGKLPWNIPDDIRRFQSITWAKPIIMGRKTHESIGCVLSSRHNFVVGKHGHVFTGAYRVNSLENALILANATPHRINEVVIIGGAQLYAEALPIANRFYLTEIYRNFRGDTYFPTWYRDEWRETESSLHEHDPNIGKPFNYKFSVLERKV